MMQQTIASRHQTMDTKPHHTSRTNKRHHKKQNKNRTHSGNHKTRHARQTSTTDGGHARERTDTHNRRQHSGRQKTRHARQTRTTDGGHARERTDTHDRRQTRTTEKKTRTTQRTAEHKQSRIGIIKLIQSKKKQKRVMHMKIAPEPISININQHQSIVRSAPILPTHKQTNQRSVYAGITLVIGSALSSSRYNQTFL